MVGVVCAYRYEETTLGLHVNGNNIRNINEEISMIRGVDRPGTQSLCVEKEHIFDENLVDFNVTYINAVKDWKLNTIMVKINEDCWLGKHMDQLKNNSKKINSKTTPAFKNGIPVEPSYFGRGYRSSLKKYIETLTNLNMMVIVSLDWTSDGKHLANSSLPMPGLEGSVEVWKQLATMFKSNPRVLFELYHSPSPGYNQSDCSSLLDGWECWCNGIRCQTSHSYKSAGMQQLLNAIRSTGASNIVLIPGIDFSNNMGRYLDYLPSDPLNQLMASVQITDQDHCNNAECWDEIYKPIYLTMPMIITRVLQQDCSADFLEKVLDYADKNYIHYLTGSWSLTSPFQCESLIENYLGKPTPYDLIFPLKIVINKGCNCTKNFTLRAASYDCSGITEKSYTHANSGLNQIVKNLFVAIATKYLKQTENFPSNEKNVIDRGSSQTDSCIKYGFQTKNYIYSFIDSPGLSDTRGIKQDEINMDKIMRAAEQAKSLTAIILVINGTITRLTVNLQNVINRLKGSIPDSLIENIYVLLTHCRPANSNFEKQSLTIPIKPKNFYYMDNSAFSKDPIDWDKEIRHDLNQGWEKSFSVLNVMLKDITSARPKSTDDFEKMIKLRFKIRSTLHQAQVDIMNLQTLQDSISIYEAQLEKANNDKETFKDFTVTKTILKTDLIPAPYHSTICSTCNVVCHDQCGLDEISTKGNNSFKKCWAMKGKNNCLECHCSYTVHYHDRKTMKSYEITIEEELEDLKNKYLSSEKDSDEAKKNISSVQDAKLIIDSALKRMTEDIKNSCVELKKLCSGFNLVDELSITLEQLEMEAWKHTSLDARKTANDIIRSITEMVNQLSQGQTTSKPGLMNSYNKSREPNSNIESKPETQSKKSGSGSESDSTSGSTKEGDLNVDGFILMNIKDSTKEN
ncbi:hypothetical protein DLAC_05939 [Tieghemostelium lacteum]|uniref:Uncharacterized protein n=1 Tax=Tieghemostelium lacteum TaxID=361077 RepID=A0A151ZHC6_TIELA|nr:hypothetical protein DLAC_05939 [Tieghemostelium lacteum]|eukprot:KYQ93280.1 hypothetical protein DLAC_05939 [Tieghemostelium lacteum]